MKALKAIGLMLKALAIYARANWQWARAATLGNKVESYACSCRADAALARIQQQLKSL